METLQLSLPLFQIAEVDLVYRGEIKASLRPQITKSKEAYELLLSQWDKGKIELQEQFKVVMLSNCNRVLGIYEASSGGVTGTIADPKLVFAAALKATACKILVAHNHPSGNLKPSGADLKLTEKLVLGGNLLDIDVVDHLIVSREGYYSFLDAGVL